MIDENYLYPSQVSALLSLLAIWLRSSLFLPCSLQAFGNLLPPHRIEKHLQEGKAALL